MAESQILGLFASPRSVEDAVRQQIRQSAPQFENAPNQRLFNAIAEAGAAFDPRVQQARQQQEVAQGVQGEFGTSQYYRDMAEQFRQRGMLQSAIVAADKAKQIDKDMMDAAKLKYGAISFVQYGSKVPEIRRLVMQIEMTKDPAAKIALEQQLTEVMRQGTQEVADREALEAGQEESAKQKEASRFATRADLQERFENANSRASAILGIMKNIGSAVEAGTIYTGPLAKVQSNMMAIAQTFGLTSAETDRMIANTERAESIIGQALLEQIKTLGTNPSNADREFLAKTLPTVLNSPEGIKKIIEYMRLKTLAARADAQNRLEYFNTPNKDGSQKFDMLGYESKAFDELNELFRKNNISASTDPDENYVPYSFEVESKHKADDTVSEANTQTAEQALDAIDQSPVSQQDYDNTNALRDQIDQGQQQPTVTAGVTAQSQPDGSEPPMVSTTPQTEQGLSSRIEQIDRDLSVASDLSGPERQALADERTRLAQAYNGIVDKRNNVIDAMVLAQMPGLIPESQKQLRLQALPRERKLIIAENMLITKFNKEGKLSPAEQTLYKAIRDELQKLGARQ